ncbi:MAG: pilus assembly PilX N-terminal domain-containing protein [Candidatus Omnitrophica bacterium]|nr:pilus assembly PilX N-terminal domain-containing protein [Candidatus Omnitrophota bacterium]MBI2173988.1 pilus assembly PilX N-terminal domain-containing protein [Candidatus Omnitrophota bacterium]MBI3009717.1 pilus assembly PilX N-terminal domain-containing protein [Candidatus Omnitrophota bacterium]
MANHRGSVAICALGVVTVLMTLGASALIQSLNEARLSSRSLARRQALYLAEAGVDQALINLRTPADAADDIGSGTLALGTFQVDLPPVSISPSQWRVTVHGIANADSVHPQHLEVMISVQPQSVFQFGLFADENLDISGSAYANSFDSRVGPYDEDPSSPTYNAGHEGDVGTNGTSFGDVALGSSVAIDGQVVVGPGVPDPAAIVVGEESATITGVPPLASQSQSFLLPPVTLPEGLTCLDQTISGGTTQTLTPTGGPLGNGTYCYDDLTIQGNATLTATGFVTVYLTGVLTAQGNSLVGVPDDPTQMLFLLVSAAEASLEQTISGSNVFYGAIYGPEATINITGNAAIFGSVVAEDVNVTGSAEIHYDEALANMTQLVSLYKTSVVSWRELN